MFWGWVEMQTMQTIEGVTPGMLWTALIVLIAGATLYVLYGKVRETYRTQQQYKKAMNDPSEKLADEISAKVLKNLEPRFKDIDMKLANDKANIDNHTRQIADLSRHADGTDKGLKAINRGVLALLNHQLHNGNTDELEEAQRSINNYLIEK